MRTFTYLGVEWEAETTGGGHGASSGYPPPVTSWGVRFQSASNPDRVYLGHTRYDDLAKATEEDLTSRPSSRPTAGRQPTAIP